MKTSPQCPSALKACAGAFVAGWALASGGALRADIFQLHNDGQVRGQLINKDESPRQSYEVRTPGGAQLTLDPTQVKKVVPQRDVEMDYDRIRLKAPDTVDGQWKMAEWCRTKQLPKQRKSHLERIVEIDPDHAEARRALGYSHIHGRWTTQKEQMESSGYIFYNGKWILPQEKDLYEFHRKEELAQKDWFRKIKMWREWLEKDNKAAQARANFAAIGNVEGDGFAVKALAAGMLAETDREVKNIYIEALTKVATPAAFDALTKASMNDTDEEVRMECLDRVVRKNYRPAVGIYVQALKSKDNVMVNRAGVALKQLKDPATVGPLIDALVTVHKFQIVKGTPGQTTSSFGTGANSNAMPGFSFGTPPVEIVKQHIQNQTVLEALLAQTAPINFEFDTVAWKYWFASQKKPATMDVRRD